MMTMMMMMMIIVTIERIYQCFDAVGWVAGRASGLSKTEWWDVGMVIWDEMQICI